jgi:hypothetical protein
MQRAILTLGAVVLSTATAHAFCGFYVNGSGERMFADATEVVLMREGTRTILSMQNDYKGPLADFAMVVPVPVVLHQQDVVALPKDVFARVDALGSPRLVEYWEQDPCPVPADPRIDPTSTTQGITITREYLRNIPAGRSVVVEARFDVAEYQIVILSATEATGLEDWLHDNHYKVPTAAAALLRPYVEAGSKFFVAKVDPKKVAMANGHAALSPLRFHYDSEDFTLPIRLGMASSSGTQDLIVNIISANKRYQVANYKSAFIPTNIDVDDSVKARFAEFYAALFDRTIAANPGAVITEYAWTAVPNYHCDPCTDADVTSPDLMALGGDVAGGQIAAGTFVLTRLHARYKPTDSTADLVFRDALPVTGGRELYSTSGLEAGARRSEQSYFQARYAIRHAWTGPIACAHPQRGVWGGATGAIAASHVAFAPRGKLVLEDVVQRDVWEIGLVKPRPAPARATSSGAGGPLAGALLALGVLAARRRR